MTILTGQFSSIRNIFVHFTQDDLHRLASDSLDITDILDSTNLDSLVPHPVDALRAATVDLLTEACPRTTDLTRIKSLVDLITFSWKDKNGDYLRIRNTAKFKECLLLAVDAQHTKFVLTAHCDLIYFAHDFNGLDLDLADTSPFPSPPRPALFPPSNVGSSASHLISVAPILPTTPPTDVFNYKALPLQVRNCFNDQQYPNIVSRISDMSEYYWIDGSTHPFYTDPSVIGSLQCAPNKAHLVQYYKVV
jgi:hypothetical protein